MMLTALKWIVGVPVGIFVVLMLYHLVNPDPEADARAEKAEREACAAAITSSMTAPIVTYTDKQAYDKHVRESCKNYNIGSSR